ncbi:glycosyltransferase [Paenibacillus sp. S150]|uniref:glycosyltransferase n=1 Tax=Paenibacillus sp. S150 TaxID=2749826 RepID=UPI001C58F4C6|nr:glycosyltransferase [Paenibacillus sp. S150]MBW4080604.1 glycosyltransferase [Paenibacillus sp. S150]
MRIAMFTNNYKPFLGGVPISIERLAQGLRQLGHTVYVFAPRYGTEQDEAFVIRYRSRKKRLKGGIVVPDIFDLSIETFFCVLEFDLIHVHHPMLMGQLAQRLARRYNLPVVYTFHTRYEEYLHYIGMLDRLQKLGTGSRLKAVRSICAKVFSVCRKLVLQHNRFFTNRCDLVFTPTPGMKDFLQEHGTVTDIEILPTGLTEYDFQYNADEVERIRVQYGRPGKYLFCTVSRLEKEKNINFILEGLKQLKANKGDCFRLLVIGDGSAKAELEREAVKLGLQDNLEFIGSIPHNEIRNFYQACSIFLFASQSETQGIVLLEAMAAGLPVLAVKGSGVSDIVENGEHGFVTENDVLLWVSHLEKLLGDSNIRKKMSDEARKEAVLYLHSSVAKTAEYGYQKVLGNERQGVLWVAQG